MTRRLFLGLLPMLLVAQQPPVTLGPVLWSDCNPTPPHLLLTWQEYEDLSAILRAAQTAGNEHAADMAIGRLRVACCGMPFIFVPPVELPIAPSPVPPLVGLVVLGPVLWSDCGPRPPLVLLTLQEYEDAARMLRAAQTAENEVEIDKAVAILRMAVGESLARDGTR